MSSLKSYLQAAGFKKRYLKSVVGGLLTDIRVEGASGVSRRERDRH